MPTSNAWKKLSPIFAFFVLIACSQAPISFKNEDDKPRVLKVDRRSWLPPAKDYIPRPWQAMEVEKTNPEFIQLLSDKRLPNHEGIFHYDEKLLKVLNFVNKAGNTVVWKDDYFNWGKSEKWAFPKLDVDGKFYEDCDGIALWKYRELVKLGLPSSPIFFTLVLYGTTGHAVLVIHTDEGDLVLDNRYPEIRTVAEAEANGYTFLQWPQRGSEFTGTWVSAYKR